MTSPLLHHNDLPPDIRPPAGALLAVDTETMGLRPERDRLCLVQCRLESGPTHLVRFDGADYSAPNLKALLADKNIVKLFHYARFDLAVMRRWLGVLAQPVFCTKIASKLARTYTDRHSLKDLLRDLLDMEISKQQQSSDWGAARLTEAQMEYAAMDVAHLHELRRILHAMLEREGRAELAQACFDFLPTQTALDLGGWQDQNIFAH